MAVTIRNCVGVDIGSHCIRTAYIEMGKAGPRVVSLLEETIKLEPDLTETQRQIRVAKQLGEMLKTGNVRTKNAVFCVPGQSVFVRRIKLPKTTPEKMGRMVRFAAREQIPFPLEKTIMEFQVFEEEEGTEADVLLVAVKRDFILNFMKLVKRTGLRPVSISVSSLALYNFHELNDSKRDLTARGGAMRGLLKKTAKKEANAKAADKKKNKKAKPGEAEAEAEAQPEAVEPIEALGFEEIRAFVNLGASLMDLAIPKPGAERMIGFTRSVPLAGNEMDRAIRDKLGVKSLEEARRIKENETAVLSTDFEIAGDSEAINVDASEAVTAVTDRLISELRRSLDFYISQPDGVAVDRLVLAGGLSRLKFLPSYIEEKMGLPVEQATPHHEQLRMADSFTGTFSPFAVAVGLALQGLGLAQNKIDFLPEDMKNYLGLRERRNEMIGMVAMLALMIAMSLNVGNDSVGVFQAQTDSYNKMVAEYQKMSSDIAAAQARDTKLATAYDKLSKALTLREYWLVFLRAFQEKRPSEVLIDDIRMHVDGNVFVEGKAPNQSAISEFVKALQTLTGGPVQPRVFNVKIMSIDPVPQTDRRFPTQVFGFQLRIKTYVRGPRIASIGTQPKPAPTPLPLR